ncbi:keratin-associated protein 5-8-like [Penaeus indicus]|uniref:keratin-associated protein 5-8-like n=1 Tax=Penaeus indicus TaxID=29960 RepID=UPI00300D2A44
MRKIISLLMNLAVLVMVISSVDSARPVKGIACREAGGGCYRGGRARRICEKYDDEANDCGGSRKCCLVTTDDPTGTIRTALKCTASCDVGTCTPRRRCAEEGRGSRCGKRCVCCTKVKPIGLKKGNAKVEKDDSSEGKGPRGPRKGQQNQNFTPSKVKQGKCTSNDDCTMKGGKCKTKCNKNGDSTLCSGDCTCCGICEAKSKCSRYDGVCKKSCDGTERTIKGGCKKKKKCTCCAPKCQQNGCQGQCVSKRKECTGQFIKNGCGGLKCHCCSTVGKLCNMPG